MHRRPREAIAGRARDLDVDGAWLSLAAEHEQSGRVVKEALLSGMSGKARRTAEIGCVLTKEIHGLGIGQEVVSAVLAAAWEHLPIQ